MRVLRAVSARIEMALEETRGPRSRAKELKRSWWMKCSSLAGQHSQSKPAGQTHKANSFEPSVISFSLFGYSEPDRLLSDLYSVS